MSLLNQPNKINLDKVENDIIQSLKKVENKIKKVEDDVGKKIETKVDKVIEEPVLIRNDTLIDLEVSDFLGNEYIPLLNDLARMITLQVTIQIMLSMRDPIEYPFFSQHFFELLFYIVLGLMTYWLVVKKIFKLI
jgi:hypothetical protein|tara:strand:- start:2240 stop:2644 length:405 start_codon:yes stop_codon:yes gene_type:complete